MQYDKKSHPQHVVLLSGSWQRYVATKHFTV